MTPVGPHQTHRSFANSYETAPNARQTTQTERRRAGNPLPALRLDPRPTRTQAPHWTPTPRRFCCMPTRARLTTRTKPAIAHLPRTTVPLDIPLSSAAKLRAPPCLPHSNFSSSDVTRRKPPARAASRSADDRESRSALLARGAALETFGLVHVHTNIRSLTSQDRSRNW